ncbi:MAG: hypothetical protein AAF456_02690 [Planctomycetota bacterium]
MPGVTDVVTGNGSCTVTFDPEQFDPVDDVTDVSFEMTVNE